MIHRAKMQREMKNNEKLTNVEVLVKSTHAHQKKQSSIKERTNTTKTHSSTSLSSHVYPPVVNLNKFILNDFMKNFKFLKTIETLNHYISDYIIKRKINVRDVEMKLKNENIKKEKEIKMSNKNLEDKLDLALNKANLCLDNIKNLGKNNVKNNMKRKQPSNNKGIIILYLFLS
jgi:hypothetical protein